MSLTYAADTSVSVEKSRAEIESILGRYGAEHFGYMTDASRAVIVFEAHGKAVRFSLPLPSKDDEAFHVKQRMYLGEPTGLKTRRDPQSAYKLWEQACRSRWRSLGLCIKAKLEAVSAGITTFETEFLAHFVLPGGKTVGEKLLPQLDDAVKNGQMPQLQLLGPTE